MRKLAIMSAVLVGVATHPFEFVGMCEWVAVDGAAPATPVDVDDFLEHRHANCLLLETGGIALREKSEFISEKLNASPDPPAGCWRRVSRSTSSRVFASLAVARGGRW